jgi:hypothetical protein
MTDPRRALDDTAVTDPPPPDERERSVTTLRNARGSADGRRVTRVVVTLGLIATAVVVAVLFAVGARKNAQISALHAQGVPVTVTVSTCRGLLGGSGSNAAGYACRGTYVVAGHRQTEAIPGDTLYAPRATVAAVAVPSDPALFTTAALLATEEPSAGVFIAPTVLLVTLVVAVVLVIVRSGFQRRALRRRRRVALVGHRTRTG